MKICLYFGNQELLKKSGVGQALEHQKRACELMGYEYCFDYHEEYDILHINTYFISSSKVIRDAKSRGKKVIFHAHSTEEDFRNSFKGSNIIAPLFKQWLIHQYSKADYILTPTEYSKELLENYQIVKPITAISNGIEIKKYEYNQAKVAAFKNYFNVDQRKTVISVGLLFERKGLIDFIELAKRNPTYLFIWFGDLNSKLICEKIKKAIKHAPNNLVFPGYVNGAVLEGAYMGSDVFLFPSFEETEGIVVLEALAARSNVLVRDIGAYHGWLANNHNCYMANSIDEFDFKLNQIIHKELPSLKEEAFLTAKNRSLNNISRKLKNIYDIVYTDDNQIISRRKMSLYN